MKFSTQEDVEAPIEAVYLMLSDFERFERAAIRRGAEVQRTSKVHPPHVGAAWDVKFSLRGKARTIRIELVKAVAPEELLFDATSQGLETQMSVELVALSQKRTRVSINLALTPKTISARLLVQSLKLAKSNLSKQFEERVAEYGRFIEDHHSRTA